MLTLHTFRLFVEKLRTQRDESSAVGFETKSKELLLKLHNAGELTPDLVNEFISYIRVDSPVIDRDLVDILSSDKYYYSLSWNALVRLGSMSARLSRISVIQLHNYTTQ